MNTPGLVYGLSFSAVKIMHHITKKIPLISSKSTIFFQLPPSPSPSISHQIPTDSTLRRISELAQKKNWHQLAAKLHFSASEVAQFESKYRGDIVHQVCPFEHDNMIAYQIIVIL